MADHASTPSARQICGAKGVAAWLATEAPLTDTSGTTGENQQGPQGADNARLPLANASVFPGASSMYATLVVQRSRVNGTVHGLWIALWIRVLEVHRGCG